MRRLFAGVVMAVVFGACGSDPSPSPSEALAPAAPPFAIACWDVVPDDCDRVAREGLARLPAGSPAVAVVSVQPRLGRLVAEFVDGRGLAVTDWSLEPGQPVVFGAWEEFPSAVVGAASPPMLGPTLRFSLGHCGLDSPIDVDGALWDPVGAIDADATAAINAADGEFRRTGPTMAEFVTATGFRVALARHEGRKSVPLCD